MAETFSVVQSTVLTGDVDLDTVIDPGDTRHHHGHDHQQLDATRRRHRRRVHRRSSTA